MLTATFCCFKGISPSAERLLWQHGILTWDDLLREGKAVLSERRMESLRTQVAEAKIALGAGLAEYFLHRLPSEYRVRIWRDFYARILALDIETDGLSHRADVLTLAAGTSERLRVYVKGVDLHEWLHSLTGSPVMVTYNGTRFDLPIMRQKFGLELSQTHLDLMEVLTVMGYRGGQKAAERRMGIHRQFSEGINGADVPGLWKAWSIFSDVDAIRRLVLYNAEDVQGLMALGSAAYRKSMSAYPLPATAPAINFRGLIPEWFGSLTTSNPQHVVGSGEI